MSEYSKLCDAIIGNPEQRKLERKKLSDALGTPILTYEKNEQVYGVWVNPENIAFSIARGRDGCYDAHMAQSFTLDEVKALAKAFEIKSSS